MSNTPLSDAQIKLLSKGLKFTPTPKSNKTELESDIKEFNRRLRLKEYFYESDENSESDTEENSDPDSKTGKPLLRNKSNWNPKPNRVPLLDTCIDMLSKTAKELGSLPVKPCRDNLSKDERQALQELQQNTDIIIKEADKGGAICIMNKSFYSSKMKQMLLDRDTYSEIESNNSKQILLEIKELSKKYSKCLFKEEEEYITKFEMKTSNLYGLPKIHKSKLIKDAIEQQNSEYINITDPNDLKFRPIIAGPASVTSRLSQLVDCILKDIPQHTQSFVRDDIHFLSKLNRKLSQTENYQLITFDVESLYTNIDKDLGIKAIKFWVHKHRDKIDPRFTEDFICDAIRIVLENNTFHFDNKFYLQIKGTAMGTKMAPTYANLVLAYLEEQLYQKISTEKGDEFGNFIRHNYLRYLDDCFIVWPTSKYNLDYFQSEINNLHPNFKFTKESSPSEIAFLDIWVYIKDHTIFTDIYYKPTDSHQMLHFRSNHPRHTRHSIPYSQARRLCTIIDEPERRDKRLIEMKTFFIERGYPSDLVDQGINKAKLIPQATLRNVTAKDTKDILPFVFSHNPRNPNITPLVRSTIETLKSNNRMKTVLKDTKFIASKRQTPSLGRILTRACFTSGDIDPTDNNGSYKCRVPRCGTCPYLNETKTIRITSTGRDFNILKHLNCQSKDVLYIMTCNGCQEQYIGMTNNKLNIRMTVHRQQINHPPLRKLGVSQHIDECSNLEIKFSITPFFKIPESKAIGLIKEEYFIKSFKPTLNSAQLSR